MQPMAELVRRYEEPNERRGDRRWALQVAAGSLLTASAAIVHNNSARIVGRSSSRNVVAGITVNEIDRETPIVDVNEKGIDDRTAQEDLETFKRNEPRDVEYLEDSALQLGTPIYVTIADGDSHRKVCLQYTRGSHQLLKVDGRYFAVKYKKLVGLGRGKLYGANIVGIEKLPQELAMTGKVAIFTDTSSLSFDDLRAVATKLSAQNVAAGEVLAAHEMGPRLLYYVLIGDVPIDTIAELPNEHEQVSAAYDRLQRDANHSDAR